MHTLHADSVKSALASCHRFFLSTSKPHGIYVFSTSGAPKTIKITHVCVTESKGLGESQLSRNTYFTQNQLAISGHEKPLPQAVQTPVASDASIRSTTARAEPFSASPPPEHPHLTPKMRDKSDARLRYIKAVRSMWGAHKKPQQPSSPCNQTWRKIPC